MPKKYNMPEVKFLSIIITSGLVKVLMLIHKTKIPAGENNAVSLYGILINLHTCKEQNDYLICCLSFLLEIESFMSL